MRSLPVALGHLLAAGADSMATSTGHVVAQAARAQAQATDQPRELTQWASQCKCTNCNLRLSRGPQPPRHRSKSRRGQLVWCSCAEGETPRGERS